jgi:hypothetical protein
MVLGIEAENARADLLTHATEARSRAAVYAGLVLADVAAELRLASGRSHEALVVTGIAAGALSGCLAIAEVVESVWYRRRATSIEDNPDDLTNAVTE